MRIGTVLVAGALVGVAGVIGLRAAQGPPAQGGAARPLVPMTASTIAREPAAHLGENVSMMAAVETVLSKTIFTVDQDKTKVHRTRGHRHRADAAGPHRIRTRT